jgi:glyoxylase-like metal-dependent hydrolase (beta-lactamase superfamily II)
MEIAPGVQQIKAGFVNLFLFSGPDGLLLIDTGLNGSHKRVLAQIQQMGASPQALKTILITHADGDHFGGLAGLQASTPATAWANPIEAAAIQAGQSSRVIKARGIAQVLFKLVLPLFKASPARIDQPLNGGEEFAVLGGLKAIPTPGHTPGHVSFYSASRKVLFAGDSIQIKGGNPVPSAGANTWDVAKAQASFQLQMALEPNLILAGHGIWTRKRLM